MYKIGADPELFVKRGRRSYPAHGLVPGTKEKPHLVEDGAVQVDGMALEFNIDPAITASEFSFRIEQVLNSLREMVPKEYKFRFTPATTFPIEDYEKQPDEAKLLGCEPDYNAYTGTTNPVPTPKQPNFRTTSGHIHVGWTSEKNPLEPGHFHDCRLLAIQLDTYLALPWMQVYGNAPEVARRRLYGKAGAFRPKPYGMEYRVLSNRWVTDERLRRWVFNSTKKALSMLDAKIFLWGNRALDGIESNFYANEVVRLVNTNKYGSELSKRRLHDAIEGIGVVLPPRIEGV